MESLGILKAREKTIVRTSIAGILANAFLATFKTIVGLLSNSIAVILDAINNFSDALSSIITIVGTKLAGKEPDKKHPFGYGRLENLTAIAISVIILYAGISSLKESIQKIIHPQTPSYSFTSLIIIGSAVVVKIILGTFVKRTGKRVNSDSLIASGQDALLDSIVSFSTLAAAIFFRLSGLSVEAYVGILISLLIIKSGLELLRGTVSQLLGERLSADLARQIKHTVNQIDGVEGTYDLTLNNYGPSKLMGSLHIAVPDTWTADKIDETTRQIQIEVAQKHQVLIEAVGIYSVNTKDDISIKARQEIRDIIKNYPEVLQMHGFYMNKSARVISFDIIIDFDVKNRKEIFAKIQEQAKAKFPDYYLQIQLDSDFSD